MHKYPQNQSYVGSNGQTLTTNVSMTLCSWQICHQTHVLCGCTTFVPNEIGYQINMVSTPGISIFFWAHHVMAKCEDMWFLVWYFFCGI